MKLVKHFFNPILDNNPISVQILGLCSALAVTQSLLPALVMAMTVICVLAFSNVAISLMRNFLPSSIRLILEITIIATAVIIADEIIKTFLPDMSRILSVFVGLIATNCIVLGRAETFARWQPPMASFLDGLGNGIGYSIFIILVAGVRELLGQGTLLSKVIWPTLTDHHSQIQNQFMTLPASAFFILGLLVWATKSLVSAKRPATDTKYKTVTTTQSTQENQR